MSTNERRKKSRIHDNLGSNKRFSKQWPQQLRGLFRGGLARGPQQNSKDSHQWHRGPKPASTAKRVTGAKSALRKSSSHQDCTHDAERQGTGGRSALSSRGKIELSSPNRQGLPPYPRLGPPWPPPDMDEDVSPGIGPGSTSHHQIGLPLVTHPVSGKLIDFLIHTGATYSALPKFLGPLSPSPVSMVGVEGRPQATRLTPSLLLTLGDQVFAHFFLVIPDCPTPLLQRDFMM